MIFSFIDGTPKHVPITNAHPAIPLINGNKIVALIVAMPIIVIIRLLAAKYHWRLPKIILKK